MDKPYPFTIDDVAVLMLKRYRIDITKADERISFTRYEEGVPAQPRYRIDVMLHPDQNQQVYIIDGNRGEVISTYSRVVEQ